MASPLEALANSLAGTTRGVSVTVKSQVTPDYTVSPFNPAVSKEQAVPGLGTAVMKFVKPSFTLNTPAGSYPIEPWGSPTKSHGFALAFGFGLMSLGGFLATKKYVLPWLAKRKRGR